MAEGNGTLTNADTAVLSIWFIRSGQYDYYATVSGWDTRNGRSYYTTIVSDGLSGTFRLEIRSDLISTTASVGKAIGKTVRSVNSFLNLLSGSYGLAVGNSTNADTAVLSFGSIRDGRYLWVQGSRDLWNTLGFGWQRTLESKAYPHALYLSALQLSTNYSNDAGNGFGICCENPSPIFSPEAMGWPWELD